MARTRTTEADRLRDEIDRLRMEAESLASACRAALPWVVLARPGADAHPEAIRAHAEDLARVRAASRRPDITGDARP